MIAQLVDGWTLNVTIQKRQWVNSDDKMTWSKNRKLEGQNQTHNKHSLRTFSSTRYWLMRSESRLMSAIVMASPITLGTRPLKIKSWEIHIVYANKWNLLKAPGKYKNKAKKINRLFSRNFFVNIQGKKSKNKVYKQYWL